MGIPTKNVFEFKTVGVPEVDQQTPLEVTTDPDAGTIIPPD